ncbi:tyrosine-type recombinase/integrase [Rhizobium mesoamericanum]|uniref:Putative integrase KpLE2 phage-like element n=1 Tax=Rhizobium mesoamericanum STM3625 TaxID=1211777 RepID=K0Q1V7_9HYPH|nr:integrase arm-type DNA-binding domain-containing protein [Rhizobium mesoamericanum]CCM78032.1 putative integrase; KpLE2 phage-like element [Rhizobium mesoamericanum STM3625]
MGLTDTKLRAIKPATTAKKYGDGEGLHLLVPAAPRDGRFWKLAYRFGGKQKTLSLGEYPYVSLADAREKRTEAKRLLAQGIDPSQQKKLDKIAQRHAHATTFNAVADDFLAKVGKEGKADATMTKKRWLLDLARPDLGKRPISEIKAAEILVPLRKVESQGNYETARRLRSTISQVFRHAVATARAEYDPTTNLRGALTAPTVTHRAALTEREGFAGLLRAVWGYEGAPETKAALSLMAYLYPRPGELRLAEWEEFDLEAAIWTIPAPRTKMRREHRKPLPPQAVKILRDQKDLTGDLPYVFPSRLTRKPISENTLNGALRRLGFTTNEMTSHGFRASASSLLNESGKWSPDAIEAELAHIGADQVRRAYHRAAYWGERVQMAQWWADEIDAMRAETR